MTLQCGQQKEVFWSADKGSLKHATCHAAHLQPEGHRGNPLSFPSGTSDLLSNAVDGQLHAGATCQVEVLRWQAGCAQHGGGLTVGQHKHLQRPAPVTYELKARMGNWQRFCLFVMEKTALQGLSEAWHGGPCTGDSK